MLENKHNLTVDTQSKSIGNAFVEVVQNDNVALEVQIYNNNLLVDNTAYTYTLLSVLPSKERIIRQGEIGPNGYPVFYLGVEEMSEVGIILAMVQVYDELGNRVTSYDFKYRMKEDMSTDGVVPSADNPKFVIVEESLLTETLVNSQTALENSEQAVTTSNSVQEQFNQVVINGDSSVESAQARVNADGSVTYRTLKDRLDTEHNQVTSQLAETETHIFNTKKEINREIIGRKTRKPMISFVDDDCKIQIMTKWKPILQEKQVPVNFAVITNAVGTSGYATWDELKELQSLGAKFASHTHTHAVMTDLTEAQLEYECATSKDILMQNGMDNDFLVYPYGSDNALVRKVTRKYFKGAIDIQSEEINVPPVETFRMNRWTLQNNTLENYKAKIDETIAVNGWLIFMSHSQYADFDANQLQYVREIIDYARSKGVDIVSLKDGYEAIGNVVDIGDYSARETGAEYTILDADGKRHSKSNNIDFKLSDENPTPSTPITDFEVNKITHNIVITANAVGFPENRGGTLLTRRYSNDSYGYQIYNIYDSNKQYKRTWDNTTKAWRPFDLLMTQTEFDKQRNYIVKGINAHPATDPITAYEVNKVTEFFVNSSGSAGYPATAGIVTTHYIGSANWNRQEFRQYQGNSIWSRYQDTTGSWTPWVKISVV